MSRQSRISEGSCLFCRKRRLRCDLKQPKCTRCQENHEHCFYGAKTQLKWVGGMAVRGRLAVSPAGKSPRSLSVEYTQNGSLSLSSPPSSPYLETSDLVLYFNNVVLPRFQIPDRLVELDFDAVMQDQALQQAISAIAQAHYAMNSKIDSSDIVLVRKRARQSAIESFRQLLQNGVTDETGAQQLFTINVLMCMLDGIIQPLDEFNASMCHLRGGFAILSHWSKTSTRMIIQDGLQAHLLSVFATMDLVHAMLSGDRPYFESITWHMFANAQTWFGSLSADNTFLSILKAYSEMACLGHVVSANLPSRDTLLLINPCLSNFEPILAIKKHIASIADKEPSNEHWSTFCSIYQICGVIYLERALRMKSIDDEAVQSATRRGVEMLIDEVLPGMLSHCLIYPILVIGSHCIHSQDRRAVLEVLSPSSSYLSFGSLQVMVNFLSQLWSSAETSSTWWECFESIAETAFLF